MKNEKLTDPLAAFENQPSETEGVLFQLENPTSGKVLLEFMLARFGGPNNSEIVRVERRLKAKLPQGLRRSLDAGTADPEVAARLNRRLFCEVAVKGFKAVDTVLAEKYPEFNIDVVSKLFEDYPKIYDVVSEAAMEEQNYLADKTAEALGN